MKKYQQLIAIFLLFVAASVSAKAQSTLEKFQVVDRNRKGKVIFSEVEFPQLLNQRFAESADFKIVSQKDSQPVEWSKLSEEDRLRAATLMHHLSIAKTFFLEVMKSEEVRKLEQVVIRMNFINDWNRLGYWSHENANPQFNTSHTIPAGKAIKTGVTWNREIWFRPAKPISVKEMLAKQEDPLNPTVKLARESVYPSQISAGVQNGFRFMFGNGNNAQQFLTSSTHQLGVVAAIEGAFLLMKQINRALLPNHYYIDTALVPEVIYHEFAHVALSDYLVPNIGTPVNEGMADYFAAWIAGGPQLAMKIKQYAQGFERNGKKKIQYGTELENRTQSTAGFVLGFLWGLHDTKKGLGPEMTRTLVWSTRSHLNTFKSEIRSDLAQALRVECQKVCANPARDDLILLQYFDRKFTNQK